MCDRTQLAQQEQQDVSRAMHDRNLSECIDGYGICDFAQLTPAEKQETPRAARDRKLEN
jgi:hypothetical protein